MVRSNYLNLSTAFGTVPYGKLLAKIGDEYKN